MKIFILRKDNVRPKVQKHQSPDKVAPATEGKPVEDAINNVGPPHSPNLLRRVLPLAAFSMAFALVMTVLILYMDSTAMRHNQFLANMSRDYEMMGVAQDEPQLIQYIRQVYLKNAVEAHHRQIEWNGGDPDPITLYVLQLLNNKTNGYFVETGAYNDDKTSPTEFLEQQLHWCGLLVQTDTRHFFNLRHHNRQRSQAIHGCLSPVSHPKEKPLTQDDSQLQQQPSDTSVLVDNSSNWTRIKCFPLYSLLLAVNVTTVDFMYLATGGDELQVLKTVPFNATNINVIAVHVNTPAEDNGVKQFLISKQYIFKANINDTLIFQYNIF